MFNLITTLIRNPWGVLLGFLALAFSLTYAYSAGGQRVQKKWDAEKLEIAATVRANAARDIKAIDNLKANYDLQKQTSAANYDAAIRRIDSLRIETRGDLQACAPAQRVDDTRQNELIRDYGKAIFAVARDADDTGQKLNALQDYVKQVCQ